MRLHSFSLIVAAFLMLVGSQTTNAETVPGVFNTGVGANGALLAPGAADPHWQVIYLGKTNPIAQPLVVLNAGFPSWHAQGPNSQWISPVADQQTAVEAGYFSYRTTIDLTGFDPATAALHLATTGDDYIYSVSLNGTVTGFLYTNGFDVWSTNDLTTGFLSGTNTLEVWVRNFSAGTSGFRSELLATATPLTLTSQLQGTNMVLSWATNLSCYQLEYSTNLASGPWTNHATLPTVSNGRFTAVATLGAEAKYFRLRRPRGAPPAPHIVINRGMGEGIEEVAHLSPEYTCDPGTGCQLQWPLDGSLVNVFDAFESVDLAGCSTNDPSLRFHWELRFPPAIQSGEKFTSRGISGYHASTLTIQPSSLPALSGADVHWRVILTITSGIDPSLYKEVLFRFQYDSSEAGLFQWQSCHTSGCLGMENSFEVLPGTEI